MPILQKAANERRVRRISIIESRDDIVIGHRGATTRFSRRASYLIPDGERRLFFCARDAIHRRDAIYYILLDEI